MNTLKDIRGSGKGGGGKTFHEEENSLRSNVYVSVIEAFGEGPIKGIVNGRKSIYLNDTPLEDEDGTRNFGGKIFFDHREGTHNQEQVQGFELAGNVTSVGVTITKKHFSVRQVPEDEAVAVGLTIGLPQGLYENDTSNNAVIGAKVELAVYTRLVGSETWIRSPVVIKYDDKTTSAYQETFRIDRPTEAGQWEIKVERVTADNTSATLRNETTWDYFTSLTPSPTAYPDVAYMALTLDASSVNTTTVPTRSAIVNGLIIEVPTNFDTYLRKYSSTPWDGTLKFDWTNDPSWVVYALATNKVWGLGLNPDRMDIDAFYDASVYNSAPITYIGRNNIKRVGPRFSFNYVINTGESAIELMQKVASVMNAKLMYVGGRLTLLQDRPGVIAHVFTRADVIGTFKYSGTPRQQRFTSCLVTWNDPKNLYKPAITAYTASTDDILKYGFNVSQIAAYGCTDEAQAFRQARWRVDSSLNLTETVTFKTGMRGQLVLPHQIINVLDNTYAGRQLAGRVLDGSTTSVIKLDRPVNLVGSSTLTLQTLDGTVIADRPITTTSGTTDTVTVSPPLSAAPPQYSSFIVTTDNVHPRLFRVASVSEDEPGIFTITANTYDPNKYARVEQNANLPTDNFISAVDTSVLPPSSIQFEEVPVYVDEKLVRNINITWTRSPSIVTGYIISWRYESGPFTTVSVPTTYYELQDALPGKLEVRIVAVSAIGLQSRPAIAIHNIGGDIESGEPSPLNAPVSLGEFKTGTAIFSEDNLNIKWTNPATNRGITPPLKDFLVSVYDTERNALLRSEYVAAVAPGQVATWSYTFESNKKDGGPRRKVRVEVRCRDANNNLSSPAALTFFNPPPAVPTNIRVKGGLGNITITYDMPRDGDLEGVLVWLSTDRNFIPSQDNLIADSTENMVTYTVPAEAKQYFVRLASYDSFDKDYTGATLNLTTAFDVTSHSIDYNNKLRNTSFESILDVSPGSWDPKIGRPIYWWEVSSDPAHTVYTIPVGRNSPRAFGLKATAVQTGPFGIRADWYNSPQQTGVRGGWKQSTPFVFSIYARDINGTGQVPSLTFDDYQPTIKQTLVAPPLSSSWQRYAFLLRWDGTPQPNGSFSFVVNGAATNYELQLDDAMVEINTELTGYEPPFNEITPGSITRTEIADDSITSPKMVAGSVIAGKLGVNAVQAGNVDADAITAREINVGELSAISADLGEITSGYLHGYGLTISSGAFTEAHEWPIAGTGYQLSGDGLLFGNFNEGPFFQITQAGDVYSNQFNIVGGNAIFSGGLSAATGTFQGELSAATGTFQGELSAATGTFSGTLTASAINAVNSINIAGNAVSIMTGGTTLNHYNVQVSITVTSADLPTGATTVPVIVNGSWHYADNQSLYIGLGKQTGTDTFDGVVADLFAAHPGSGGAWASTITTDVGVGTHYFRCGILTSSSTFTDNFTTTDANVHQLSISVMLGKR